MDTEERPYDRNSDGHWSSEVYHRAKDLLREILPTKSEGMRLSDICEAMRRKYPALCDDKIRDKNNPKLPYWKHLVSTAISNLKTGGKIEHSGDNWVWYGGERRKIAVSPPQPHQHTPIPLSPDADITEKLKNRLLTLESRQFENVVEKILRAMGLEDTKVTGKTADGGVDVEGIIPVIDIKVAVQVKRYTPQNNVGIDPVQRLIGSVTSGNYDRGMFITTSSFTAGAKEVANRPGSKIVLIDSEKLVNIMLEKGLGIQRVPLIKEELDTKFFENVSD